jgi:hypothetical protein
MMSRKKEALILKNLDGLNPTEAHLLFVALEKKAQTIYWDKDAKEIPSLMDKGLLESIPDESTLRHKPFRIPKYVWDHLQQNEVFQNLKTKDGENTQSGFDK